MRERAVRMVFEHQGEFDSQSAAIKSIARKIGCGPHTLRPAERVIRSLDRIIEWRGKPGNPRVDDGPEYIIESIEEPQDHATQWVWTYTNGRPNLSIGGITPAIRLKMAA